jgi:3'-phosphoadenosine 5'-phosphosulfate sulfotransferase (PAPS reductase)/FAD synthetase
MSNQRPAHLAILEAESIQIFREVAAQASRPVLLYSIGKDSSVLLHLARKAFFPAKLPFPLVHIDTTWKFRAMIEFRDLTVRRFGLDLRTHTNPDGLRDNINPFDHGGAYTQIMKTDALKQALTSPSAALGVTRNARGRRSGFSRSARPAMPGTRSGSGRNFGISTTANWRRAKPCGCFRCRTGPSWMCGPTSRRKGSTLCRCISPPCARRWSVAGS